MRITNKIMNNNSMYNINNNKVAEDEVNTQMATGKKIARPSDDPVIAIRALRLRSTVTQLDQYYTKNAKDAEYILCQPAKSCGAGCKWSYEYYKSKHRNTSIPHYGDQIFLNTKAGKCCHTGMVYKVDSKYVYYVAGNEGGGNGEVQKHKLLKTSKNIYAYGRPRYTDTV